MRDNIIYYLPPTFKSRDKQLKEYLYSIYINMPKMCEFQNCRKRASYGIKRNCPTRCKSHKENRKLASFICICSKARPSFNEPGETSAICCASCKTSTMVDIKNKKCVCGKKQPSFNEPGETNTICCASCKTATMVDIKSKKCICGKALPYFNEPGETTAICCASCKNDTMVDIKNKKCICGKSQPVFNEPDKTDAVCCSTCKTDAMIDVVNKKCICGKARPNFNEPGERAAICCASCKTETMVNVVSKMCLCGKAIPSFNEPGETTSICCASCKNDTMVDIKNKKCICGKTQPFFNEPGETIAVCCASCKTATMVNIKSKKCICGKAQPNYNELGETDAICCTSCKTATMVDIKNNKCNGYMNMDTNTLEPCPNKTRGNIKYKNYCTECFRRNFPLDPITFQIRSKTKEIAVRDFINANFEGFQHNKRLQTGHCDCTIRRSIDHRMLIGNTLIAIETDENQHKAYDEMDEETRYDDLFMAHSGKWIYIRFNPDKYVNAQGVCRNPMIATRLEALKKEIEKQIKRIEHEENTELVERVYMYYDGYN